jgi:hypothetical protein
MLELTGAIVAEMRGGERKEMYCHVGVPTRTTFIFFALGVSSLFFCNNLQDYDQRSE